MLITMMAGRFQRFAFQRFSERRGGFIFLFMLYNLFIII